MPPVRSENGSECPLLSLAVPNGGGAALDSQTGSAPARNGAICGDDLGAMCGACPYSSTSQRARNELDGNGDADGDGDGGGGGSDGSSGGGGGGGSGGDGVGDSQCPSNYFLGYFSDTWKLADLAKSLKKGHSDWRGRFLLRGLFWAVPLLLIVLVPQFAALTSGPRDLTRLVDFPRGVRAGGEGDVMPEIETESGTVTETATQTVTKAVTETVTEPSAAAARDVAEEEHKNAEGGVGKQEGLAASGTAAEGGVGDMAEEGDAEGGAGDMAEEGDAYVHAGEDARVAENEDTGNAENEGKNEDVDKNGGGRTEGRGNPEKGSEKDESGPERESPAREPGEASSREISESNQATGNQERANDASPPNENAANRSNSESETKGASDADELMAELEQRTLGDVEPLDSPRVLEYLRINPRLTWETEWLPVRREDYFRPGEKYYFVTGQRDFCAGIRHFHRSLSCKIAEAAFLNRTLVLDMGLCVNGLHSGGSASVHGLHYYYDLPSLK
ncbi:unnamed protein product [Closterium sp. NIES-54]